MSIFHFVQALIMGALLLIFEDFRDFSIQIKTYYREYTQDVSGNTVPVNVEDNLFNLEYAGLLAALFLLMSAVAHFLIAGPLSERYHENLTKHKNVYRWYEYALSSSVMIILIALLLGIVDFWLILMMVFLNATMNLFGLAMEEQNEAKENVDWKNYFWGWIAGIGPWLVISAYFFNTEPFDAIPDFVLIIYIAMFIAFMSFGFNMGLQYAKIGPWSDYLFGEKVYQILSLVAKSFLAWLLFWGITFSSTTY